MITEFCDLGKMGDTDDLVMLRQFRQLTADHLCRSAADTGIHFVKDDGLNLIRFG